RRQRDRAHTLERDQGPGAVADRPPHGLQLCCALRPRQRSVSCHHSAAQRALAGTLGRLLACGAGAGMSPATVTPSSALATPARGKAGAGPLMEVQGCKKLFTMITGLFSRVSGEVRAVDGVSFHIKAGETWGLVGESGCGKSTVGRTMLRLLEPSAGSILVDGVDITGFDAEGLLPYRKRLQMIYQDP